MEKMRITEIEPGKKYVLVMPGASKEQTQLVAHKLRLLDEAGEGIVFVYGMDVSIVPADQIVGYTTLE